MLDEGAVAPDPGQDHRLVLGMQAHLAGQAQQPEALFQVHGLGRPALGQGGSLRLLALAQLDEGTEPAGLQEDGEARLRIGPQLAVARRRVALLGGRAELPGVAALGIVGAADEGLEAARLEGQLARAALGAGPAAFAREQEGAQGGVQGLDHIAGGLLQDLGGGGLELAPELPEQGLPVEVAGRDLVEFFLERRGEVILDIAVEEGLQEDRDQPALVLGDEAVLLHPDIAPVAQDRQDRGVGRGPAYAQLLHLADQAGLGIPRRRLGEVLVGLRLAHLGGGALRQGGQAAAFLVLGVVPAFLVHLEVAVEEDDLAGGPQAGAAVRGGEVDRGPLDPRRLHLRGQHPLPDQLVEAAEVAFQPEGAGVPGEAGGPDRLVRLLGVAGLGPVLAGGLRQVVPAEQAGDDLAGLLEGLGRRLHAVGPHVGDQAHCLAADVHALVELLRGLHGALGREAQLAGGLLLQGRGREGRGGRTAGGLLLDGGDGEGAGLDRLAGGLGGIGVGQVELGELSALVHREAGDEGGAGRGHVGLDGPVLPGDEALDLDLAVDDQPQGHRLHPSGGSGARKLAPKHGGEVEADQVVQGPAGQVGLDQLHVDLARRLHRLGDGRLGDGVEDHPLNGLVLHGALGAQDVQDVPGDGLALAVGVGGQDDAVRGLGRLGDLRQALGGLGVDLPGHGEVLVRADRAVLGRQVADMSVARQDLVVRPQVLVDGLGLGRALDDDEVHAVPWGPLAL